LNIIGVVGNYINMFINSMKGGRNECFMYGIEKVRQWFDYDLTAAYTTVMSFLGHPLYEKAHIVDKSDLEK
jgi:hypothetical protein